jgi:hypothetical protein
MKHRTMQGKEIDMEKLMQKHELMPAIGNMKVNARGDELGAGGKIVRKREDVVAEYYNTDTAVKSKSKKAPSTVEVMTEPVAAPVSKKKNTSEE